ncbi:MAG TPA: DUF4230 domain-containing protein, partial [Bacteroidales bacterium]|nr:DUF4230 domain-containing protein [Bacteroidales bacterium]
LRGMERVEVSSAYMDRLLIVKDETVPYNNIRLVLSVPVQVTWTADMSLVSFERQEDGAFLVRLPQVVAGEARYEVERASNLDVSTGFGMSSTWASFQDVFALFSKAVEEDRKALGAELGKAEHLARAEQALRRMILAAAAARGIEVRFAPPAD